MKKIAAIIGLMVGLVVASVNPMPGWMTPSGPSASSINSNAAALIHDSLTAGTGKWSASKVTADTGDFGVVVATDTTKTFDTVIVNKFFRAKGTAYADSLFTIGGTHNTAIEPEGGAILQVFKDSAAAAVNNSNLQLVGYNTGSVLHFINAGGTRSSPLVTPQGSVSSIGWRWFGNVAGNVRANASSAAVIVTKTGTDTGAVPATDMALQTGDGSGTRPTRVYIAPNGFVGVGARSSVSLPVAQLDVRASTAGTAVIYASTTRTSLSNTALYGEATGTGSAENIGLYLEAKNGTLNKGIQIHAPVAGAGNYAIYSDATAQSSFAGTVSSTVFNTTNSAASGSGTMILGTASPCASGTMVWIPFQYQGASGYIPWCAP